MLIEMKKLFTVLFLFVSFHCLAQTDSLQVVKRVGNMGVNKPLSIEYGGNPEHQGHSEVGTIISIRKGPVHVVGARFIINKISLPDTAVLTVNIYEVKDGKPTANGLYRPVKITGAVKEGQLNVDLTGYNIIMSDDFMLALSWSSGRGSISFGGGMHGGRSFHRNDNQEWERAPMKLGFSALIAVTHPNSP